MKRRITVISAIVIVLALLGFGSISYFTVDDTARNVITTGKIGFEIHEVTDKGEKYPIDAVSVMPGQTVSKIVTMQNTGDHPLYLRVKLTKAIDDKKLAVGDRLKVDLNEKDWTEKDDGYIYYNKVVEPQEETAPLFTKASFDGPSIGNEYMGKFFTLKIDGSAVQSENNGDDVFDAIGWNDEQ